MVGAAAECSIRRATSERGYVIPDLGRKVEHLKGLLGHLFRNQYLADRTIAKRLGVSQSQWARKKGGTPVTAAELGRLLAHFGLLRKREHFDYTLFKLPFDEFVAVLLKAEVGMPGADGQEALRELLSRANRRGSGIRLRQVAHRRAGLGINPPVTGDDAMMFPVGARVMLEVDVAERGYLLLLNDCYPAGETTCLMPSLFRPARTVTRGTVVLPAEGTGESAMTVVGPAGDYRLYAIWTREPLEFGWMKAADTKLHALGDNSLMALADELRSRTAPGAYLIRTAEYQVDSQRR